MKNKGFTLIELMIVIAIIGILVSIAMTAYTGGEKHQSKTQTAFENYYNDKKVEPVYIANDKRSADVLTLKRHSDGQLYACDVNDVCKEITQ